MKILVVCLFGQNRSVHLKKYLQEKGYEAESGGIQEDHNSLQNKINNADIVVSVQSYIQDELKSGFNIDGKKLLALDVQDDPEHPTYSHPSLDEQMDRFLPFEQ